jgi:hypothetical protein
MLEDTLDHLRENETSITSRILPTFSAGPRSATFWYGPLFAALARISTQSRHFSPEDGRFDLSGMT